MNQRPHTIPPALQQQVLIRIALAALCLLIAVSLLFLESGVMATPFPAGRSCAYRQCGVYPLGRRKRRFSGADGRRPEGRGDPVSQPPQGTAYGGRRKGPASRAAQPA